MNILTYDGRKAMEYLQIADGLRAPRIGLGTFDLKEDSIRTGLEAGYRLFDTAWQYKNEDQVGKAVKESGIAREEVLITTKLWTRHIRMGKAREALEESLRSLNLDYVDLYLIHWPAKGYEKAWEVMNTLKEEGKVKAIGVSNFNSHHLEAITRAGSVPAINQVESHPYFPNDEVIAQCRKRGICAQAWCPLGGPYSNLKSDKVFEHLSQKYKKTPAQIILRWHMQRGMMAIPRSSSKKRLEENLEIFDFWLEEADMTKIDKLDTGKRMGADPDNFDF